MFLASGQGSPGVQILYKLNHMSFWSSNDLLHQNALQLKFDIYTNVNSGSSIIQTLYTKTEDDRTSEEDSLTKGFYHKSVGMAATLVM